GRLAVASLFCATLKQEGSLFVLLAAAVVWLRLRGPSARGSRSLAAAALALPVAAHWIVMRIVRGSPPSRDFDLSLLEPARWSELVGRFGLVVGRIVGIEARLALAPILAIAMYFLVTRRGIGDPLIPVFLAQL